MMSSDSVEELIGGRRLVDANDLMGVEADGVGRQE